MSILSQPTLLLIARAAVVVGAVVGFIAGCMFEPANETVLRSRSQILEFRGVTLAPRATVRIDAAGAPSGPFTVITTTQSSGNPTVIGGATLYEFSVSIAVPDARWAQTCTGSETFVRARGGSLVFTTYDSALIAGVSGEECIDNEIAGATPFVFAARSCASDYGAPARLSTPEAPLSITVLGRDLRIVNPYQAEDYACLTAVDGDLAIVDPSNTDLAFPDLESVSGDLTVRYPRELGDAASRLVDLPALASVGGSVLLESLRPVGVNPGVLLAIGFGMPALSQIGGALSIEFEGVGAGFDSVSGLPALTTQAGDLTVRNRLTLDTGYASLLPALVEVGGNTTLALGLTCTGVLSALEAVAGDFSLEVGTLMGATSLDSLAEVGGDATLQIAVPVGGELPSLISVAGSLAVTYDTSAPADPLSPYLENLGSVGGPLRVSNSFASPVPGDAPLAVGGLELDANAGLVDLAGTLSHVSVAPTGAISFTNNPNISDCEAQDWVDALNGHPGPETVSGNGPC